MSWGKGITIFMIAFMAFIASMVYYAFTKNADLVRDDYYENEINFDATKESRQNYQTLGKKVEVAQQQEGVVFYFPENVTSATDGVITFYRPDQKRYDREFKLSADSDHKQTLEYNNFKEGYYDVSVEWTEEGKSYLFEDHISF